MYVCVYIYIYTCIYVYTGSLWNETMLNHATMYVLLRLADIASAKSWGVSNVCMWVPSRGQVSTTQTSPLRTPSHW